MKTPKGAIIAAIDSSPDSELGLRWAAAESARSHAPLHVLHCLDLQLLEFPLTRHEVLALRENAEQLIEGFMKLAVEWGAVSVSGEIVQASPVTALLRASRSVTMIVVGARGHGLLYRMWLGSTSEQVTKRACCPVVVVRQETESALSRIVVGVDASPASDRALGLAFQLAVRRGAPITVIHAWLDHAPATLAAGSPAWSATNRRIESGRELLSGALARWRARYPEVDTSLAAVPVRPARALTDASEHAALLVVGAHRGSRIALGSVARAVVRQARCTVAVVP